MEFNANRVDEANAVVTAVVTKEIIEANLDKVAKEASRTMNIQGFRKGKVPVAVVKQRFAEKLKEDAEGEAIRKILKDGLKTLEIKNDDLIGEPSVTKFDKKEDGSIEVEITVATKPNINLGDYKSLVPAVEEKEIDAALIDARLTEIAKSSAPFRKNCKKKSSKRG